MKKRIFLIDNLKFILIFLVVFGHYIEPFIHDNVILMDIYKFIYSFHMPLFALATGFFAKPYTSIKDLKTPMLQFLTFEVIYALLIGVTILLRPENMDFFTSQVASTDMWSQIMLLFTPVWILWYLWAIMCWRGLITFLPKNKWIIYLSFIVAILMGAVSIFDGAFSIQRVFCFFPFFYLGYYLDFNQLQNIIAKVRPYTFTLAIAIPLALLVVNKIEYQWFYFSDYYSYLDASFIHGAIIRALMLVWALYMSFMLLSLCPTKENRFTKYGVNTLYIYIGHGIIMILILFFDLFAFAINPLTFVIVLLSCILSMFVLVRKPISTIIDILSWRKNAKN